MVAVKDYYKVLGVSEAVTPDELKRVYRKAAREHHPDRNPGNAQAEERFKDIQEAYAVLSDPEKRKKYDRMRKNPFSGGDFGGAGSGYQRAPDGTYVRFEDAGGLEDLFGSAGGMGDFFSRMFGSADAGAAPGATGRRRSARQRNASTTLRLSFEQALRGGKTEVRLPDGEAIRIDIPKGVDSGFKIRLKGRGQPSPAGGRRGDLYVTFEVQPHDVFRRSGNDVFMAVEISPFEAMLGASRSITNPYGKRVRLTIPPGTQPGDKLRLKGLGIQTADEVGDLFAVIDIKIPRDLTEDQKRLLSETGRSGGWL